jgi:hypothetical protein
MASNFLILLQFTDSHTVILVGGGGGGDQALGFVELVNLYCYAFHLGTQSFSLQVEMTRAVMSSYDDVPSYTVHVRGPW